MLEKTAIKPTIEIIEEETDPQLPSLNVNMQPIVRKDEEKPLVKNDEMVVLYKEILEYCREDRKDANESFHKFLDMIINDGDATHSTKESLVNLLKIRSETTDKMSKVMDLLMRYILKDRDTMPRYLAASQENFIFKTGNSKREFLAKLDKIQKKDEK